MREKVRPSEEVKVVNRSNEVFLIQETLVHVMDETFH